jgi:hypothetical protein
VIVSRVAVCCPTDRACDDAESGDDDVSIAPGGRWFLDALMPSLTNRGVVVMFSEARFGYWALELRYGGAAFRLTVSHPYPYTCNVHLFTRRGVMDRLLFRDHAALAEDVFQVVCETMRTNPHAGRMLDWRGDPTGVDAFERAASAKLGGPRSGVVRVDPRPAEEPPPASESGTETGPG